MNAHLQNGLLCVKSENPTHSLTHPLTGGVTGRHLDSCWWKVLLRQLRNVCFLIHNPTWSTC